MRYMNEENFSQQELFEQEQYISDLASKPGIDLTQHRSMLERILKMLEQSIGSKAKQGDE